MADMLSMNQRQEPRFETAEPLWITLLGEPDIELPARVRNVSARGIGLELRGPVAAGTALKITLDDAIVLGEVIYCRQDDDAASFYVGVVLEQALCGLGELSHALRAFSDSPSRPQQADPVKDRTYQY